MYNISLTPDIFNNIYAFVCDPDSCGQDAKLILNQRPDDVAFCCCYDIDPEIIGLQKIHHLNHWLIERIAVLQPVECSFRKAFPAILNR